MDMEAQRPTDPSARPHRTRRSRPPTDPTAPLVDALLAAPTTRFVLLTDGAGAPRYARGREGETPAALSLAADIAVGALGHFARTQGFGEVRLSFVLCQGATVVLGALRGGAALTVVAEAEANLGLLLNACRKAQAAFDEIGGSDAGGA